MGEVEHNPHNLEFSNEVDLSTRINTINTVEHDVTTERTAENQEEDVEVLLFCQLTFSVSCRLATNSFDNNCYFSTTNQLKCTFLVTCQIVL